MVHKPRQIVIIFIYLLSLCCCNIVKHEPEHLRQNSLGYLESELILKGFSDLEADIQGLKGELAEMKSKYQDQPKTIFAQIQLLGTHVFKAGERIIFTSSVANIGNAYNNQNGYFEAPCNGTYLFSVTLCTAGDNWVVFRVVQDGNILGEGHPGDSSWHACAPVTVVTHMKVRSKVWVEIDRIHKGTISSAYGIPSFTGVFLNNYQQP